MTVHRQSTSMLGADQAQGFQMLGYGFTVRSSIPGIADAVSRLLAPFAMATDDGRVPVYDFTPVTLGPGRYRLQLDGQDLNVTNRLGLLIELLIAEVTRKAIESEQARVAVHAGVVACGGRAVVLAGPPDAGKTTLVAALVRSGLEFLSDEVALFSSERGTVEPFPRPLIMDERSLRMLGKLAVDVRDRYRGLVPRSYVLSADDLREGATAASSEVAAIILLQYEDGVGTRLEPIPRPDALITLIDQTFNMDRFLGNGVRLLGGLVADVPCYRLKFGDLPMAVGLVRQVLET